VCASFDTILLGVKKELKQRRGTLAIEQQSQLLPPTTKRTCVVTMSRNSAIGIDIRDALSILSSRAVAGGDVGLHEGTEEISDEHKAMGQTIDLLESTEASNSGCGCGSRSRADVGEGIESGESDRASCGATSADALTSIDQQQMKKDLEKRRKEREEEIQTKLKDMPIRSLLNTVFEAQRERTTTYQEYDRYVFG